MKIDTAGLHAVTVSALEIGQSEAGKPYITLNFVRKEDNATAVGFLSLTDKNDPNKLSEFTFKTLLDAFKFDGDFERINEQVIGKDCSIVTQFEDRNGKELLRVQYINPLSSARPLEDGSSLLKRLSAQAKALPQIYRPGSAPIRPQSPKQTPAPVSTQPAPVADPFA